ncbi:MAG: hypothetical protein ACYDEJ_07855 [Desulfitobacteriaceae bacterium]
MKFFNGSEVKTYLFVVICKKLISTEIKIFFKQKERAIYTLLPEIIKNKKAYSVLFNKYDLEKIYKITEKIMVKMLLKRYKNLPVPVIQFERIGNNRIDFFNLIRKYQIKQRKKLSKKKTFMEITNLFLKNLLVEFKIRMFLLPKSRNSRLEKTELNKELNRISKALNSIKRGMIQEINCQITSTFFETHDLLINSKNKNSLPKIAYDEAHKTEVLEA